MKNKNKIAINNSKPFNTGMGKISECNLQGDPHACKVVNINLGDKAVPMFLGTNSNFNADYFTDAVDKMLFQRIVGLALKKGLKYNEEGVFIPMRFSLQEILEEITKRDLAASYLSSVDEIKARILALRKIDVFIDTERRILDENGKIKGTFKKEECPVLLNASYTKITETKEYKGKTYERGYISLFEFPKLWAINEQCESEILYFSKELFDFKTITDKTGDLKYIPARESLLYQALKECIVKRIANSKNFLKSKNLIKASRKGYYKLPVEKTGKTKWEENRRINYISLLNELGICDGAGELRGRYKEYAKRRFLETLKADIAGILAALKTKGFIDDYYEYKTVSVSSKRSNFAGWVVDPSVNYDELYNGKAIVDAEI